MTVSELMKEILQADIKPDVFKVFVAATDHTSGFIAWASFRSNQTNPNNISHVEVQADTAEIALCNLRDELLQRFKKCENCGNYCNHPAAGKQ